MFKALYDFVIDDENGLSFHVNDRFTVLDNSGEHWWLVQNGTGKIGYVPGNYLAKDDSSYNDVISSIDRAISAINFQTKLRGGNYTEKQIANLQKLEKHKQNVLEEQRKSTEHVATHSSPQHHATKQGTSPGSVRRAAPVVPGIDSTQSEPAFQEHQGHPHSPKKNKEKRSSKRMSAPPAPPQRDEGDAHQPPKYVFSANKPNTTNEAVMVPSMDLVYESESGIISSKASGNKNLNNKLSQGSSDLERRTSATDVEQIVGDIEVPQDIGTEMVEIVRRKTNLSDDMSREAVGTVINHLKHKIPELNSLLEKVLLNIVQSKKSPIDFEGSLDAQRLNEILLRLTEAKDDSQQRSWALHEDEHVITNYLEEVLSILNNAHSDVCKKVVSQDHYAAVHSLVLYYQMETRVSLRLKLLPVFGALCGLDKQLISELLNSVLPLELARDIRDHGSKDLQKLGYSLLVLTMLFSMGEELPLQYYEHLDEQFLVLILDMVENPPVDNDQIPDMCVNVLLAYNLHFMMPDENLLMRTLANRGTEKTFTEKVMILFNRGEDPVRMFEHEPKPPDSLLKFFSDLYSSPSTACLLYTNDAKVLVDIMLQRMVDLSPGDNLRTEFLSLLHLFLSNSKESYGEHLHKRKEIESALNRIQREEEKESDMDRRIVKTIWAQFPQWFSYKV